MQANGIAGQRTNLNQWTMRVLPSKASAFQSPTFWWALAAACFVAGVRILQISAWGGSTPYFDECNTTGFLHIHASHAAFGIPWAWFVYPHMEHWLITQRVYSLLIAAVNSNQWDVRAEMVVGTFGWAALAAVLVSAGGRGFAGWRTAVWAGVVVAAEVIPHAWENLLWAFQIQFLFLIALSIAALRGLARYKPLSLRWWMGWFCGALACMSQASGLIAFAAAAFVSLFAAWRDPAKRSSKAFLALAIVIGSALAAKLCQPDAPWHDHLHAHDVATWLRAVVALSSWPCSGHPWMSAFIWLPAAVFVVRLIAGRALVDGENLFVFGWIIWSAAQIAAAAWARGSALILDYPPSRYADVLVVGVLANAWIVLRSVRSANGSSRVAGLAITGAWLAMIFAGDLAYTQRTANTGTLASTINRFSRKEFVASRAVHRAAFREYQLTGDPTKLEVTPPIYPVTAHLEEIVQKLKAAHRWPVVLDPNSAQPPPRLSRLAANPAPLGVSLLLLGAISAALAVARQRRYLPPPL